MQVLLFMLLLSVGTSGTRKSYYDPRIHSRYRWDPNFPVDLGLPAEIKVAIYRWREVF